MIHFIDRLLLSSRREFALVSRQFFAPSLHILYAADFKYLIRWVIVTYILLDISVINYHATSQNESIFSVVHEISRTFKC